MPYSLSRIVRRRPLNRRAPALPAPNALNARAGSLPPPSTEVLRSSGVEWVVPRGAVYVCVCWEIRRGLRVCRRYLCARARSRAHITSHGTCSCPVDRSWGAMGGRRAGSLVKMRKLFSRTEPGEIVGWRDQQTSSNIVGGLIHLSVIGGLLVLIRGVGLLVVPAHPRVHTWRLLNSASQAAQRGEEYTQAVECIRRRSCSWTRPLSGAPSRAAPNSSEDPWQVWVWLGQNPWVEPSAPEKYPGSVDDGPP